MTERELFEAWAVKTGYVVSGPPRSEEYLSAHARDAWAVWQAARATPADHVSQVRNAVIEECAKVCDENAMKLFDGATKAGATALQITAYQIRALTTPSDELDKGV